MKNDRSDRPNHPGPKRRDERPAKPPHYGPDSSREWKPQAKSPPRLQASLWGVHAVQEAWTNPERVIRALYVTEQAFKSFAPRIEAAREAGLRRPQPVIMDKKDMDRRLPPGAVHQGIAADAEALPEVFVQDLVAATAAAGHAVILMLDQVTDPHNVGAILRSASAFGAAGVIMQRRHSPEPVGALAKAACGAVDHLPIAYETNLSRALEVLQQAGFFAIALDEHESGSLSAVAGHPKSVLVLGAEGSGLRQKIREQCDARACLPTSGPIRSLNVSNAAAIALYALTASRPD